MASVEIGGLDGARRKSMNAGLEPPRSQVVFLSAQKESQSGAWELGGRGEDWFEVAIGRFGFSDVTLKLEGRVCENGRMET